MKNEMNTRHQHCGFGGLTFGILVILTGIVLLGVNFGWIDPALKTVVFSWPMLLSGFSRLATDIFSRHSLCLGLELFSFCRK